MRALRPTKPSRARQGHLTNKAVLRHSVLTGQRAKIATKAAQTDATERAVPAITLTENAVKRLTELKQQKAGSDAEDDELLLRIGVKKGGCSGLSYVMDFETSDKIDEEDAVKDLDGGLKLVCDPKSLLYLFGMELDFSNELIGGGFKFNNPNADKTCGCGKSFSA